MATYTPPPYFPQGSLSPPDSRRYLKFKLIMTTIILGVLALIGAVVLGLWFLIAAVLN